MSIPQVRLGIFFIRHANYVTPKLPPNEYSYKLSTHIVFISQG